MSILEIFTYLYDKYGDLDKVDIENLDRQLAESFDISKPFSIFIKRIKDIIKVVKAAGCAYIPA